MATLRSYDAAFEQNALTEAAVARYRFNEEPDATIATDSVDGLSGEYRAGAAPGAAGSIGDGAASFNGSTGFVVVNPLTGTLRVATLGDSLSDPDFAGGNSFADDFEAALESRGVEVSYFDHAVNGNRSDQGLARVDDVIDDSPDVVILELGTNDAIQERAVEDVVESLREIITQLRAEDIQVLVTGTFGWYPERNGGVGYDSAEDRDAFEAIFSNLVAEFDDPGVVLLRDSAGSDKFLGGARDAGVLADLDDDVIVGGVLETGDPATLADNAFTADGLHPNAAGFDLIVPRIVPQTLALGAAAGALGDPLAQDSGSFEVWFTADSIGQRQTLFSKNANEPGAGRISAQLRENGSIVIIISAASINVEVASAAGVVEAGQPTHVTFNFGAGGMELFVNGVSVDTDAFTGGITTAEPLTIGVEAGFSTPGGTFDDLQRFFDGTIDEFAIYDRALTANEVQQLFQGGQSGSTVVGTAEDDTLIGGSADEELRGGAGDDVIDGGAGNDRLLGGRGNDTLHGGLGDDELLGGNGDDELHGGAGDDLLDGKDGDDLLAGGDGNDRLEGGEGADILSGAAGDDRLFGNRGTDDLHGGDGNDLLDGGQGKDDLTGGAGSDTFRIEDVDQGVDKVHDFEAGEGGDVLDLDAVLNFESGDDFEDFVRLSEVNGNAKVEVDANGGGDDFTAVFNLIGGAGLDIGNLVDDGNIQLTTPTS